MLLVIIMAIGLFTGCKKNTKKKGDNVLTVGIPQDVTVPDYDKNALTVYLEDATGIDIEWVFYASAASNYAQQLATACAANEELPDVLIGFRDLGHYTVNQYGEDGYFIDLKNLIDEYAVNYKKQLSELPEDLQKYVAEKGTNTTNGAFYGMPVGDCLNIPDKMQSMMYINQTWLDAVGMKAPTTVSELEAVCEAFVTKDPNGNGEADEIAMLGDTTIIYWLINAFVEYDHNDFNIKNGKVWDPLTTDEFRQGLAWVNELTEKGYLNELSYTYTTTERKGLISPTDGDMRVGIFSGHPESNTNAQTDALNHFTALGVLGDATGKGGYNVINEHASTISWSGFITKDCKDTELAMKFLDAFYTDECVTRQRFGEKDVDWKYEEGTNISGTKSYAKLINSNVWFDRSLNKVLGNLLGFETEWNYSAVIDNGEGRIGQTFRIAKEGYDVLMNSGKKREGQTSGLIYTPKEYETREMKVGEIYSYVNENVILFCQGELDVEDDKKWNEFKSTLSSLGQDEFVKIAQDAYDRKSK